MSLCNAVQVAVGPAAIQGSDADSQHFLNGAPVEVWEFTAVNVEPPSPVANEELFL